MQTFISLLQKMIIAAVRNERDMEKALQSGVESIFYLSPNILTLDETVRGAHEVDKKIFLHMDLAEGIGKDKAGIEYVKQKGVDGVISTRVNIIKAAREAGLFTVQRFFIVDSQSVNTTLEGIKASKPDMIEIMPGIATKVIADLKAKLNSPIIAGGMIESRLEVRDALQSGATAVSTSKRELWGKVKA